MKNLVRFALLVVLSTLLVGCVVHAPLPGDGRRVTFVAPSMGGKDVQILNNIRDVNMNCRKVEDHYSGDTSPDTTAVMGDTARFFFSHQALRERREAAILCTFTTLDDPPVYVGVREVRVSLSNRGGQYESEFVTINRIDQPERVRIRD